MATAGNGADNKSYCSKRGRICCALTLFAVLAVSLLVCVLTPWLYSSVIQPEIKELIDEVHITDTINCCMFDSVTL